MFFFVGRLRMYFQISEPVVGKVTCHVFGVFIAPHLEALQMSAGGDVGKVWATRVE